METGSNSWSSMVSGAGQQPSMMMVRGKSDKYYVSGLDCNSMAFVAFAVAAKTKTPKKKKKKREKKSRIGGPH